MDAIAIYPAHVSSISVTTVIFLASHQPHDPDQILNDFPGPDEGMRRLAFADILRIPWMTLARAVTIVTMSASSS